jgi:5,10-methylenetetrahydromethanopterin reductase
MADARRFSVGVGLWQQLAPDRLVELARLVEDEGLDHVWYANHKLYRDMFVGLTLIAANTSRIGLGTFIAEPYSQHPGQIAAAAATIDEIAGGGRMRIALGSGGGSLRALGLERGRPLATMSEATTVIRRLVAGEQLDHDGQMFRLREAKLRAPLGRPIPVIVAARGDRMLELAGRLADGAMVATYATPDGLGQARQLVTQGLAGAGRDMDSFELYARVDLAIDDDLEAARHAVRPVIAMMAMASYPDAAFIRRVGLELPPDFEEMCRQKDEDLALASGHLVPDEFVDKFAWVGTPGRVADQVARAVREGYGNVVVLPQPLSRDPGRAITRFAREVLPAVDALLAG